MVHMLTHYSSPDAAEEVGGLRCHPDDPDRTFIGEAMSNCSQCHSYIIFAQPERLISHKHQKMGYPL